MKNNTFFKPNAKITIENEYFMIKNDIFDLNFIVRSTKRYKDKGQFVKGKLLVEYRELDCYETLTYIYLCRAANNKENAFPSYAGIAKNVKCSKAKAQECITVLNENGFIYKENRFNPKGEYQSNVYCVNTKLKELRENLNIAYANKKSEIIEVSNKPSTPILSDNTPILSDNIGGSMSDNTPILSDGKEKEQEKKNNIKKEQYNNNNQESVVVTTEEITTLKSQLYVLLNLTLPDNDLESIAIVLKENFNSIDKDIVKKICTLIKSSNKPIHNIPGFFIVAIKKNFSNISYNSKNNTENLKFNNFDQRIYDYDLLERKLLGWE